MCYAINTPPQKNWLFWALQLGVLIFGIPTMGQEYSFRFKQYTTEKGLVYNNVNRFWQDEDGYMWIATEQGLSKFDGLDFKNYYHAPEDSNSIPHNQVKFLLGDSTGNLWAVTRGGLWQLSTRDGQVKNFVHEPQNEHSLPPKNLRSILLKQAGKYLWIGTLNKGLIRFNKKTGHSKYYLLTPPSPHWRCANTINRIIQDVADSSRLWLATAKGLYSFDKEKETFEHHDFKPYGFGGLNFKTLYMSEPNELWCGTWGKGLIQYKIDQSIVSFSELPGVEDPKIIVSALLPFNESHLMVGIFQHGLYLFDLRNKAFKPVPLGETATLNRGIGISDIYQDRSGAIWIATDRNGFFIWHPRSNFFKKLRLPSYGADGKPLSNARITDVKYLSNREVTLATFYHDNGSGIIEYDTNHKLKRLVPFPYSKPGRDSRMYFLYLDSKGEVWTSEYGELFQYDIEQGKFSARHSGLFEGLPYPPSQLNAMIESHDGDIWLCAGHQGILHIDTQSGRLHQYIHGKLYPNLSKAFFSFDLLEGPNGEIWVATSDGVLVIEPGTNTIHRPNFFEGELRGEMATSLSMDKSGNIWCATGSAGVLVINPKDKTKKRLYDRSDGLPSNIARTLAFDSSGNLMMATTGGLAILTNDSGKIRGYTSADGLYPARCEGLQLCDNGVLYLYNAPEPSYCHTDELKIDSMPVPIAIRSFRANNKEIADAPEINKQDRIELSHHQNLITVSFAALSFHKPQQQKYAYMLKGLDKTWQYAEGTNREATYANLSPGSYTFQLKAANDDGVWNKQLRQLQITIRPPWWGTTWAICSYIIFSMGIVYIINNFLTSKRRVAEEASRLKDIDEFKTRFYTNITHEFRTPITVIQGMAKEIIGNNQPKELILRNSQRLLQLVNQLLDLSKLEEGQSPLQLKNGDIVAFLQYLTASLQSLAAKKSIRLTFYAEEPQFITAFDPEKLQQIVHNLLSNALKFTPPEGKVILHFRQDTERSMQLIVQDSGAGIASNELPNIFNRFYQVEAHGDSVQGTGIGLAIVKELVELMDGGIEVDSQLNVGSRFKIILPILQVPEHIPPAESAETGRTQPTSLTFPPKNTLVLIIEDNADVITYLKKCLQEDRYQLETATNGEEGIQVALKLIPDLVICDVMMPIKDGYQVCSTLKGDERTSHIPIIMLTAKSTQRDRVAGLETGADAYIAKPFDKKELEVRLEQLLELRKKLQERYTTGIPLGHTSSPDEQFLYKLHQFINQELENEALSVHDISAHMMLSRMQIHRKLKALIGMSITQLIRSIRLKKAKHLLQNTDSRVSEIAYRVGYSDPNYFTRQFTKEFGMNPSDVRK